MFRMILILASILGLAACTTTVQQPYQAAVQRMPPTNQPNPVAPTPQTALLPFIGLDGTLVVSQQGGAVDLLVSLNGLDPIQRYAISVGAESGAGALFDVQNAQVLAGRALDETIFAPDWDGHLKIRATHPARITRNGRVMVYLADPAFKPLGRSDRLSGP